MSANSFTPGPWKVFEHSWSETSIVADGFDHGICLLDINHATEESQDQDAEVMSANARLISAAPDLLEALRMMLDAHAIPSTGCKERPAYEAAQAAIAKATGAQP